MNALIFAAGLGTRLKPLTDSIPKALVPVGGVPVLQILIEKMRRSGVDNVVVNVHHFADQIEKFVRDNNSFGLNIRLSDEREMLLETGGGLRKAAPMFSDSTPIIVHNADILSNVDLADFYASVVRDPQQPTTLLVSQRNTTRYLLADEDDWLVGWINTSTGQIKSPYPDLNPNKYRKVAFSGIHVFNPTLLPLMASWPEKFSIMDFYLSICDKVVIKLCELPGLKLLDIGKTDTLSQAETFLKNI